MRRSKMKLGFTHMHGTIPPRPLIDMSQPTQVPRRQISYCDTLLVGNIIKHILGRIPYKEAPREKVKLPDRKKLNKYQSPDYPFKFIPEVF